MEMASFTMRQLLEAGVHFGHHKRRWNPKMASYIYGVRNSIHIINLESTVPMLDRALKAVRDIAASGGRILFVGTKRQASEAIATAATSCGQYYVNHRWLGGTLTNWKTISHSIQALIELEKQLESIEAESHARLTKKELLSLTRKKEKLDKALGGIREMGGLPDLVFVIDANKEITAIKEAKKLNIPIIAIVDTNCDPEGIMYPVPGNDDAGRAIQLYCDLVAKAVLEGLQAEAISSGIDVGNNHASAAKNDKASAPVSSNVQNEDESYKGEEGAHVENATSEVGGEMTLEEKEENIKN